MDYTDLDRAIRQGTARETVPGQVVDTLAAVATGHAPPPLPAMRHPLGFLCLPIQRAGDLGVCVHVWTARLRAAAPTTSAVHAHSWDLRSFVLYGRVRNELLLISDEPDRPTHRVFEVHSHADVDEIRATSRLVRYTVAEGRTSGAGESYDVPAGKFHTTLIEGEQEAATVALGRTSPAALDLSLGSLHTQTHHVRRTRCDQAEAALAAHTVLDRLRTTCPT